MFLTVQLDGFEGRNLVINPEARPHSQAYSGGDEANAFEEVAFYNPNRETSYTMGG